MYYFIYCTWLDPEELKKYSETAVFVTKAHAVNHQIQFRTAADDRDRGWCHISNATDALGEVAYGIVYEFPEEDSCADYDDFERCFLTVHGDDGKVYDCFTYRLINPGIAMRPPNYYWEHIPNGARHWKLPPDYIAKIEEIYNSAQPCPKADRPIPSANPGASAASR